MRLYIPDGKGNLSGGRVMRGENKSRNATERPRCQAVADVVADAVGRLETGTRVAQDFELPALAEALGMEITADPPGKKYPISTE